MQNSTISQYGVQGAVFATPNLTAWQNRPITFYQYDGNSNVKSTLTLDGDLNDPGERRTTLRYDKLDRVIEITEPGVIDGDTLSNALVAPKTLFLYDNLGNLKAVRDPLGRETFYRYDEWSREVESVSSPANGLFDPITRGGLLTSDTFDDEDLGLSRDPINGVTLTQVDYGFVDGSSLPSSETDSWMITITDTLGNKTDIATDFLGRTIQTTRQGTRKHPDSGIDEETEFVTRYWYDNDNMVTAMTDAEGNTTRYDYDGLGMLASVTQHSVENQNATVVNPTTTYQYDNGRRLTSVKDPINRVTQYENNLAGQVTKVIPPVPGPDSKVPGTNQLSPTTTYTYDTIGNLVGVEDRLGNIDTYAYDNLLRLTESTDADGHSTIRSYDLVGNLTSLKDPNDNTTSWVYDNLNRTTSSTDELGKSRDYRYDLVGNLRNAVDRNLREIRYTYDSNNRVKTEDLVTTPGVDFEYEFDVVGNLTSQKALLSPFASGTIDTTYTYDDFYRAEKEEQVYSGTSLTNVDFDRTYDKVSNLRTTKVDANGNAHTNEYQYDSIYRVTDITQSGTGVAAKHVDFVYDAASQLRRMDRSSTDVAAPDIQSLHDWDDAGRLTGISHIDPSVTTDDNPPVTNGVTSDWLSWVHPESTRDIAVVQVRRGQRW